MLFIIYDMRNLFYDLPDELIHIINKYKPWYWEPGAEEHIEKNKKTITSISINPIQPWVELRKYIVKQYALKLKTQTSQPEAFFFWIWDDSYLLWRPAYVKPNIFSFGLNRSDGIPRYGTTHVTEYKGHEYEEWDYCWNTYWRRQRQPNMP